MSDNKEIQSEETEQKKIQNNRLNAMLISSLIILALLLVVNAIQHRITITTDNEEVNAFIENCCTKNCEKEYIANAWNRLENGEAITPLNCGPIPTNEFHFVMKDDKLCRFYESAFNEWTLSWYTEEEIEQMIEDGRLHREDTYEPVYINVALEEILDNYKDYEVHQDYINSGSDDAVKPIIYIYNNTDNKNLQLSLTLDNIADKNSLVLYPLADKYTDIDTDSINLIWNITTNEDNTITASDNKEYSYIFWEAKRGRIVDWNNTKGFCVKGEDTLEFLQSTLSEIGLTPKEYNEMIVYWLPLMKDNKYNLITFAGLDKNDAYYNTTKIELSNENEELDFNELRVFMITQPSDNYVDLEPQEFETFNRTDNAITVVEWGGTQINR